MFRDAPFPHTVMVPTKDMDGIFGAHRLAAGPRTHRETSMSGSDRPQFTDPKTARAQAKAEKAYRKASRPFYKKKRFILLAIIVLIVLIVILASTSGGGGSSSSSSSSSSGSNSSSGGS